MMHHIKDAAADIIVFLLAFMVSTGACTQKVVTCDGAARAVEARK